MKQWFSLLGLMGLLAVLLGLVGNKVWRPTRLSDSSLDRLRANLLALGTLLLLPFAFWGIWPWLATEHARLDPVQQWLIWAGDGTAILWTVWFGLWHGVLGKPFPAGRAKDRGFRWVLLTLFTGLAADGIGTATNAYQEGAGYAGRVQSPLAELTGGRTSEKGGRAYMACRFQDQAGGWHTSRLSFSLNKPHPALEAIIRGGQFPVPVQIKYDPDWPKRCWLMPELVEEHQPLFFLSIIILVFQILLMICALGHYWFLRPLIGRMPIYQFVPVWGVITPMCCVGLLAAYLGEGSNGGGRNEDGPGEGAHGETPQAKKVEGHPKTVSRRLPLSHPVSPRRRRQQLVHEQADRGIGIPRFSRRFAVSYPTACAGKGFSRATALPPAGSCVRPARRSAFGMDYSGRPAVNSWKSPRTSKSPRPADQLVGRFRGDDTARRME